MIKVTAVFAAMLIVCAGISVAQEKRLRFVFITACVNEEFFNPVKKGMNDAAKLMDVDCTFVGTQDVDLKSQAGMVNKAVADGCDGIVLNIIDPVAFDDVIANAINKGVPVVCFNVDDNKTPNARLGAVCQNLYEAGRTMGKESAKFIPPGSKILMTMHSAGISALDDRLRGAQEILKKKNISWKVVVTGIVREKAVEVIEKELKSDPNIKYMLGTGQVDTEAAGLAIEKSFAGKGYISAGFDLSPNTLRLIKAGVIKFTIDQQPYIQGFYPVVQLAQYCRYGIKPANIDAGAALITKDNVDNVLKLNEAGYR